ncbi:uncharacterized protein LOC129944440 [Eupeodes corollae]|uniref:uncharacterized protein LOC129944440 n=1 Tax=Eupeodes corollae TaxID=290404 RepID=UPI0024932E04|nr:uncharacterized protein LOC129944440 [Eupeodes corollae]
MQKFPLRNQCKPNNNKAFGSSDTHIQIKGREREQQGRDCYSCSPHKMPPPAPATATAFAPQRTQQRIYQPIASDATSLEKRQLSMEKPAVKVCSRVFTKEGADAENVATWNDVLSRSSFCSIRKDYSKHKLKQDQKQKQHQTT